MNKFQKISLVHNTLIAAVLLVLFVPNFAFAQSFVQDILWRVVNAVFGFFAYVGGMTLDYAVTQYVVGFGQNMRVSGTGNSVNILWTVVRDIFNLTFIFGLVYIGLKMILNSSDSRARGMLVSLVLAALLVNFSLFITKFVIDFSNITAAQIAAAFPLRDGTYSVSSSFMTILGFNDLFNARGSLQNIAGSSAGFTYIFSTMFLYIVLAFVFLAGGILLIIRYIVLIIYMILSPVMFLGWVFPGFASASDDFWRKFLKRAFFAPAYLLMLYFSNQVLVNMQGASGVNRTSMGAAFSGQPEQLSSNFGAVFPFFFMAAGFLIASLVVAQKMGAQGADTAMAMGKRVANRTKKITVGAVGWAPRKAVNYAGDKAGKYGNRLQTKNFKNNGLVGGAVGWVARTNVMDRAGGAVTGGMKNAQLGTGTTNEAEKEYKRKTMIKVNQTAAEEDRKKQVKTAEETLENNKAEAKDLNKALEDLAKAMKDMTEAEKEQFILARQNKADFKTVAINLSEGDIEKLEKSGKFSASEIGGIKAARSAGFKSVAQTGHTFTTPDASGDFTGTPTHSKAVDVDPASGKAVIDRRKIISNMSTKDAGKLPVTLFKDPSMYDVITPAMLEERLRNGVGSDMPDIKKAMYSRFSIPAGGLPSTTPSLSSKSPWVKWENGNSTYAAQFFA